MNNERWLALAISGLDKTSSAVDVGDKLSDKKNAIEQALLNKLKQADYKVVINWIVDQVPISINASQDAMLLESAWMFFKMSNYTADEMKQIDPEQEMQFMMDLLEKYNTKRQQALQMANQADTCY